MHSELTPGQRAGIQAKRMTLALGLDERQQEQVGTLLLQHLREREQERERRRAEGTSGEDNDAEKRYLRINERLDRQIALQEQLRGILSERQFETWKSRREARRPGRHGHSGKQGMRKNRRGRC
mgnify:CR=1 FL=1